MAQGSADRPVPGPADRRIPGGRRREAGSKMDFSPVRQCPTKVSEVMRAQEKHPRADETVSQRLGSAADLQSPEREESTRIQRSVWHMDARRRLSEAEGWTAVSLSLSASLSLSTCLPSCSGIKADLWCRGAPQSQTSPASSVKPGTSSCLQTVSQKPPPAPLL